MSLLPKDLPEKPMWKEFPGIEFLSTLYQSKCRYLMLQWFVLIWGCILFSQLYCKFFENRNYLTHLWISHITKHRIIQKTLWKLIILRNITVKTNWHRAEQLLFGFLRWDHQPSCTQQVPLIWGHWELFYHGLRREELQLEFSYIHALHLQLQLTFKKEQKEFLWLPPCLPLYYHLLNHLKALL